MLLKIREKKDRGFHRNGRGILDSKSEFIRRGKMKYGIYFAYWVREYVDEFTQFIPRAKKDGFDILEIGAFDLVKQNDAYFEHLNEAAKEYDMILTAGYGPSRQYNIASKDTAAVEKALVFYENMFRQLQKANIHSIGGGLYSYWPVTDVADLDKEGDFDRSVQGMKKMADLASRYDVTLNMESLNRFEGYLINTAEEAVKYVEAVDKPNVRIHLDTFHMNVEEVSITDAIKTAGKYLGHFHVGEANRQPPKPGRMPWAEIGKALKEVSYDKYVVFEPFVLKGGKVGEDIHLWRDLSGGADEEEMDRTLASSLAYLKKTFSEA